MLTWQFITKEMYDSLPASNKSSDKLFFLKDTNEIFCGTSKFNESVVVYKNYPTTNISGKVYINGDTLEGKMWSNSKWITIINPVIQIPIGELSIDTVSAIIYSTTKNRINIMMKDGTTNTINLSNLIIDFIYDKELEDGLIEHVSAIVTETGQFIDISSFLNIKINEDIISILFEDSSTTININTKELLDISVGESCYPIVITGNEFIASSILYSNNKNKCIYDNNGLYLVFNQNRLNTSLYSAFIADGTSEPELSETISTDTISQIISTLESSVDNRMLKVGTGHAGEIIIADDEGDAYPSGVKIGRSTIAEEPTNTLVATEQAIVDYINENTINKNRICTSDSIPNSAEEASNSKVASEKSMIKVMSWNVIL